MLSVGVGHGATVVSNRAFSGKVLGFERDLTGLGGICVTRYRIDGLEFMDIELWARNRDAQGPTTANAVSRR